MEGSLKENFFLDNCNRILGKQNVFKGVPLDHNGLIGRKTGRTKSIGFFDPQSCMYHYLGSAVFWQLKWILHKRLYTKFTGACLL